MVFYLVVCDGRGIVGGGRLEKVLGWQSWTFDCVRMEASVVCVDRVLARSPKKTVTKKRCLALNRGWLA